MKNSMSGSRNVGYVEEDFDFRFQFPFSAVISGPSDSGKTVFVKNLCNADKMINVKIDNIVFLYGFWQPLYDELLSLFDIKFIEGIPNLFFFFFFLFFFFINIFILFIFFF